MMKEKSYKILKSFGQTTHKYKIKKNKWNIINIRECEEVRFDSANVSTMFETTISKNYRMDRRYYV